MKKISNKTAIIFIFILMIAMAMGDNVRGIFVPLIKNDFNINNSQVSMVFALGSIGYMVFTYVGGILCEKLGQKKVFIIGILISMISFKMLSASSSFAFFLAGNLLLNIGFANVGIATNTITPVLFVSYQAILFTMIHFFYGVGTAFTQRYSGVLLSNGVSWRSIYLYITMVFVVMLLLSFFIKIPTLHKEKKEKIDNGKVFTNKLLYMFAIALGFYVSAEVLVANWFTNFVESSYHLDKLQSSFYLSAFFIVFTVGRLLCGFVVEKYGHLNVVAISLIIACIGMLIGITLKENGFYIIVASAIFFSVGFPTLVMSVGKVFKDNSAYVTGIVITMGSSINMIMNLVMGNLNDLIGTYMSFYLIPFSLFVSVVSVYLIYINTKECFVKEQTVTV